MSELQTGPNAADMFFYGLGQVIMWGLALYGIWTVFNFFYKPYVANKHINRPRKYMAVLPPDPEQTQNGQETPVTFAQGEDRPMSRARRAVAPTQPFVPPMPPLPTSATYGNFKWLCGEEKDTGTSAWVLFDNKGNSFGTYPDQDAAFEEAFKRTHKVKK